MKKSESITELAKAMNEFMSTIKQPSKSAKNPFFKSRYSPIEDVVESINNTSKACGLSYTQWGVNDADKVGVATMIMHSSGEWIEYDPIFAIPAKKDAQGVGAVLTYMRRYSLSAAFGITSDEDDDGNSAIHNQEKPEGTYDLAKVLVDAALRTGLKQLDLYNEASSTLNINKPTKDLTDQEKKAIIAVLLKK